MSEYTNSGYLYPNLNKTKDSKQPDYTGKISIDGEEKQLAAWIKTSEKNNKKYLSVKWSELYKKELGEPAKPIAYVIPEVMDVQQEIDDGLPF